MGRKCFVPNCNSGYRTCNERVRLFKAPSDIARLEQWRRAIARTDRILTPSDSVCAKHFAKDAISDKYYSEMDGVVLLDAPKRAVLSADAVPSLFPNCPRYFTRSSSKLRKRHRPAHARERRRRKLVHIDATQAEPISSAAVAERVGTETASECPGKRQNLECATLTSCPTVGGSKTASPRDAQRTETALSYTQDNVSVRMLSSRGEETVSGKLEITKEKHGHVVTWTAYPSKDKEQEQQQRYDENSAGIWEELSADSTVSYHVGGKDKCQSTDSVKIKKENGTPASGDPPSPGPHSTVSFEVRDLTSYRCRQVADTHELTLNLSDGTRLPTFIFIERRYEHFIRALHEHVSFKRSRKDPLLHLVQMRPDEALHKSFDQLDLYPEYRSRYDVIRKFLTNPTWDATWDGFAKVANYVTGASSGFPGEDYRLGYGYLEEQQPDSLTGLEISDHSEEPGFEVVVRTLPKRTEVKRSTPLCHEEWAMAHDPEGRILNEATLRERIFRGGIAADLRREVWPFLLGYYSFDSTYKEREALRKKLKDYYYRMKLQWKSISEDQESRFADYRERKNLVEKDVSRTDRTHVFYQGENNAKVEMLNDILMTYVMYNFDLGYVQGMSDLLSPILMVMDNEEDAFWCFVGFIKRVVSNFDIDQSGMKKQLTQLYNILAVAVPKLAIYLEEHESGNLYFCFRWLLVLFKREFKCEEIMRLWEVLWTDLPCKNFHLLLCVAILDHEKDLLIENNYGLNEILKHVNDMCYRIDLELILSTAEAIVEQLKGSMKLPESVQEALGIHIPNGASSADACTDAAAVNADLNAPASPESLHGGQRTCSTSSVEVLSDGDVEARYECHLQFSL